MTTYGYEDTLARRAAAAGPLSLAGSSGYFAARAEGLDPALFERGDHLRPEVRAYILRMLYTFWSKQFVRPRDWSTAWIAGSGITTAWNADREADGAPGDLDVLIGVDYHVFFRDNPQYAGNSEVALVSMFNQQLHDGLWPETAQTKINGSTFELTYYVNPGGSDIRQINPYAAYNVSDDIWTVHPVQVPKGFDESYFGNLDRQRVLFDQQEAVSIIGDFNHALETYRAAIDRPAQVNAGVLLHHAIRQGATLFDEIHDGRHVAFAPGGRGYFDPANYRWQAGKGNGTVPAMRQLKQLDQGAHRDLAAPCGDANHLLLVAALANGR